MVVVTGKPASMNGRGQNSNGKLSAQWSIARRCTGLRTAGVCCPRAAALPSCTRRGGHLRALGPKRPQEPEQVQGTGGWCKRVSCGNWVPTATRPPPRSICEVTLPLPAGGRGEGPDMEAVPPARSSLLGILLLLVKLSVLLVQNRVHLYNLLLLKILFFNHWLSGLAREAWGSRGRQAFPAPGFDASPLCLALQAGLGLLGVPVRLGLRAPRLAWAGVRRCARALGLAPKRLGLSAATCADLLLSCLHSLMLAGLLLSLLTWRLCRRARRCSLRGLLSKALLDNRVVPELRVLLKRLYWWVETTTALTWHLAYLVTWTTCLASYLLQAAFEHTAQLAQAQEAEPPQGSGPSSASPLPEPLGPKAGPTLPEHGTPTE
ncbi:transmembrane protein 270 isoform X2 [Meles meles]|uniref:transmembrane protein 270 isoform X2 n=1 Tax=Meles meles TaxID=9662 RepID=UPI001E698EB4|nr:transmembrane protein 270 isoform X2 [Meles meles]